LNSPFTMVDFSGTVNYHDVTSPASDILLLLIIKTSWSRQPLQLLAILFSLRWLVKGLWRLFIIRRCS